MLENIELYKFKAFNARTKINIRPLTILCGVNSGGKSSVLKSLLLMKQSYESNSSANEIVLNGLYSMNGSMKDVIYNGVGNSFTLGNKFTIKDSGTKYNRNSKQDISSAKELRKIFNTTGDGEFVIENEIKFNIGHQENLLSTNYIHEYTITINRSTFNKKSDYFKPCKIKLMYKKDGKYDVKLESFPTIEKKWVDADLPDCTCYFSGMKVNNLYCENPPANTKLQDFLNNVYSMFRIVANQYEGVRYLGPLRDFPERQYVVSKNNVGISISGSDIPFVLAKNENRKVSKLLYPPNEESDFDNKISSVDNSFVNAVNEWMRYFDLGNLKLFNENGVLTIKINEQNISDVGFGVSQVLPIIVEAMALQMEQTLILEQPEIHLHPKMQMRMADLILTMASTNHNLVVETHSDHIINRVIRRVLEDKNSTLINNIAIYFIENTNDGSKLRPIVIDRVQGVVDCPEEFFNQFAAETNLIVNAGFNNLKRED